MRIAITAIDLEQKEHRGIAAVTKSLIEILYKNGAEIFLITSVDLMIYISSNYLYHVQLRAYIVDK